MASSRASGSSSNSGGCAVTVAQRVCPMCTSFESPSVSTVLSHLRTVHSNDPKFCVTCGLDGCATTSKSFSALYSHIYRRHPGIVKKRRQPLVDMTLDTTESQISSVLPSSAGDVHLIGM